MNTHQDFYTLRQRGYYMSEQDVLNEQDKAVAKCLGRRRVLSAAETRAMVIAQEIQAFGKKLAEQPFNVEPDPSRTWLNMDVIKPYIEDVKTARQDLLEAQQHASRLGVSPPEPILR